MNEQTMHLVDIANQIPLQSATDTIAGGLAKIASPAWLWLEVMILKPKTSGYKG